MFQGFVCFGIYLSDIFNCLCTWFILVIFYQEFFVYYVGEVDLEMDGVVEG